MTKSHNKSEYTLTFINAPQLTRGSVELLEENANAAIKYLADNISWQGVLDFVVYWDKDRYLGSYWRDGGPGFGAYGDSFNGVLAGLGEAFTVKFYHYPLHKAAVDLCCRCATLQIYTVFNCVHFPLQSCCTVYIFYHIQSNVEITLKKL